MNTRMLVAVIVSMFVCQQVHAQDESEAKVTELEGTWEVVSEMIEGEQIGDDCNRIRFEGNRWYDRFVDTEENWTLHGTFSVDPSAMPAEIELSDMLGIYELDGNSLTICHRAGGKPRPDRFESTEDYPTALIVLRRVEEDDE